MSQPSAAAGAATGAPSVVVPTLETERLLLRAFRAGDLDDYAALNADREVLRYLTGGPEPWDRSRSWRHMLFLMGHWLFGGAGMWALEHKESGAFVGMVGFAGPECWPGFELAWTLARRFWSHGYATEGAREALAWAFNVRKEERVISLIHPENRASIRVAERLGERLEGHAEVFGWDMLCYAIDRERYRSLSRDRRTVLGTPENVNPCARRSRRDGLASGGRR
jgi:RimJ/RimL family protein N-acetyltransferase